MENHEWKRVVLLNFIDDWFDERCHTYFADLVYTNCWDSDHHVLHWQIDMWKRFIFVRRDFCYLLMAMFDVIADGSVWKIFYWAIGLMAYCAALVCLSSKDQSVTIVKFYVLTEKLLWFAQRCGLQMMEITGSFVGSQHGSKKTNLWTFSFQLKFLSIYHKNQRLLVMDSFSF